MKQLDLALAVARGTLTAERHDQVDLQQIVTEEIGRRSEAAISLEPQTRPSHFVEGDAVALRSMVSNLLDNAERYGNRCRVSIRSSGQTITLHVEDDGPGIAADDRELVFEPFYRLETSRSKVTGGSGLGLAITKQIVESHGGTIALSDAASGGAQFTVSLPVTTR